MEFDDFFERKNKYYGNYNEHGDHNDSRYPHNQSNNYYKSNSHPQWINILEKIRNNNKLKLLVIITGISVLIIVTFLVILLFPYIIKLLNYTSQIGLQGLLDIIFGFFEKIWKGSGQ